MNNQKYFSIDPIEYENIRENLDTIVNMPSGETVCSPSQNCLKDVSGNIVIAIRLEHCNLSPYKEEIGAAISGGFCNEITKEEYDSCVPQKTLGEE